MSFFLLYTPKRDGRSRTAAITSAVSFAFLATIFPAWAQAPKPPTPPKAVAAAPATPLTPASPVSPKASAPRSTGSEDVVARIGDRDITISDVRSYLGGLSASDQAELVSDPARLNQAVRQILASQLLLKEATDKKWQEQAVVTAQLDRLRDNAIVETYLQAVSQPPANYPDEAEIQRAYDANKTAFVVPRLYRIAQIFVSLPATADKAAEEQAKRKIADIQARLKQPKADFAAIANEATEQNGTAERGGEIGWVAESQLLPEIRSQVAGLSESGVTEAIKLADGWHIVKLLETKPSETRPLATVRNQLVQRLRAQRAEALRRAYIAKVIEQNRLVVNELALTRVFDSSTETKATR
ncbi:peptidylprolyl isomerase [Rhodomicrobium lacus]|uniref:peptidylprolyl isomerase n=1 Tax=Rhodomicrobium lacus TaxID=2498452 RepID=UPI000F8F2EA2|nr:peptidylprolyl isomerase [Rhodomicrobium lacus]